MYLKSSLGLFLFFEFRDTESFNFFDSPGCLHIVHGLLLQIQHCSEQNCG